MFQFYMSQLASGGAEYTDCISVESYDSKIMCPVHEIKQSDGEALVILELWGMWRNSSLPSLPGTLK